jgi:hypothetical protein
MAAGCLFLWTGIPLAWMRIAGWLSSTGYVAYAIAFCGCITTMVGWGWGLARLNAVYLRLRGREPSSARPTWGPGGRRELTLLDRLVIASALLALVAFLLWYFVLAGTPSGTPWPDETSGRGT